MKNKHGWRRFVCPLLLAWGLIQGETYGLEPDIVVLGSSRRPEPTRTILRWFSSGYYRKAGEGRDQTDRAATAQVAPTGPKKWYPS